VNTIHNKDWCTPIVAAIKGYYESEDGVVDKRVAIMARNYHIIDDTFYRKEVCVTAQVHISNPSQATAP
jgi:hypothetical protein